MRNHLVIKSPFLYEPVPGNSVLPLECTGKSRTVKLGFNVDGSASVYLSYYDDMREAVLLSRVTGVLDLEFQIDVDSYLSVIPHDKAAVFMMRRDRCQFVEKTTDESFTSLAIRPQRNSELDRMMKFMQLNEANRQRQFDKEVIRRDKQIQELLAAVPEQVGEEDLLEGGQDADDEPEQVTESNVDA